MSTPILPFAFWASGTNQNSIPANDNSRRNQIINGEVISQAIAAQPGSPAEGDIYIIAASPTGAQWAGFTAKDLAIYSGGTWYAFAPVEGVVVNVAGTLYKYDGGVWVAVTTAGGMTNPMTTAEDIIKGGASGAPARLAVGTNGQVLTVTTGAVGWATPAAGFTNPMTTIGDVIVGDTGGAAIRLANGTAGYVLTAVAGAPPAWTASSGGALTNWTEAVNSAAPNGTVPVVSFTATNAAANVDVALVQKGTGALTADIADNATSGGNKRGPRAVDWQMQRSAAGAVASGSNSVIGGGDGNTASNTYATVAGGLTNTASGAQSTVGGGESNTASATNATVAGGKSNTASGIGATISGGKSHNATTGSYQVICGGDTNTASGDYSCVTGGLSNTANSPYARVSGNIGHTHAIQKADVFGSGLSNNQRADYVVRFNTANATATKLTADGGAASATNTCAMQDNSVTVFQAIIAAKQGVSTNSMGWIITGMLQRGTGVGSVAIVGTPAVTVIGNNGGNAWTAVLVADTTNGSYTIEVVGAAATSIQWFATIQAAECYIN